MPEQAKEIAEVFADVIDASSAARQRFVALVAEVRPELHRYCTRMTGSVFDGEDVVQDTMAKAWYALAQMDAQTDTPPPLRPWLFRIAHNVATDFLRRYERRHVDDDASLELVADDHAFNADTPPDDARTTEAIALLLTLPPVQRSAWVFAEVLELSLAETATAMSTTVGAVKAALVRARANVARARTQSASGTRPPHAVQTADIAQLRRYADLFNARDWNALRTFFDQETRLDLVSYRELRGAPAAQYFTRYEQSAPAESIRLEPGYVDGTLALAVFRGEASTTPSYFVHLAWNDARITLVRDYRHVPYIARDAEFVRWGD